MKALVLKTQSFEYLELSFKEWLDTLGYAPTTVYQLPNCIREFFYHLEQQGIKHIGQVEQKHFKQHYQNLKHRSNQRRGGALSSAYLNKHLQALTKFSDYLRQNGRHQMPDLNIRWEAAESHIPDVLSVEEIQHLLNACETHPSGDKWEAIAMRDKALLSVFYSCGLRRNEGYHLNTADINLDSRVLYVRKGKNNRERFVPLSPHSAKTFEYYLIDARPYFRNSKQEEALFLSCRGRRMESQSIALRLKLLQQRAEIEKEITLHTLRHSIATHLLEAGMNLEQISRFLGHRSLESTQIYTHLVEHEEDL